MSAKKRQNRKRRRAMRTGLSNVFDLARHRQHPGPFGTRRYSGRRSGR